MKIVGDNVTKKDYDDFFEGFNDPYGEKREQERLQKEQVRKEKTTGILNPQLPYDTNRAFGLLGTEDDSYNYKKQISTPSGALNGFQTAFRNSQFESELSPMVIRPNTSAVI